MKIESLEEFQRIIGEACTGYHSYLLEDQVACMEEGEMQYAAQRLEQVKEFYPVLIEICSAAGKLTPFQE
ncbi:conserved hypothetical protein [Edwardsiella phage PEi26]|uniref:Uncharacterized protein n=1 Tax=Edwardsiella phage PEi26 TaxID=1608311 RepID=A0A0B6VPA6_9CAUD|nr:conserved hypothetical protein [Edwardsiella phage PEi26]